MRATVDPTIRVNCSTHGDSAAVLIQDRYACLHCNPNAQREESYVERKVRLMQPSDLI